MDNLKLLVSRILGALLFVLILVGLYKGGAWIIQNIDMSPKSLAMASLALIVFPIALTIVLATQSRSAYTSGPAAYAVMVLPLGIFGLVVSGAWYLLAKFF